MLQRYNKVDCGGGIKAGRGVESSRRLMDTCMPLSHPKVHLKDWGPYLELGSNMEAQKGFLEYTLLVATVFCTLMPVGHSSPGLCKQVNLIPPKGSLGPPQFPQCPNSMLFIMFFALFMTHSHCQWSLAVPALPAFCSLYSLLNLWLVNKSKLRVPGRQSAF